MGKKPSVGRPKGKNVLAKALSGQQQKQQLKEQQQRAEQAAQDRAQAAKNKIVQQGGPQAKKKRRLAAIGPDGQGRRGPDDVVGESVDEREARALARKKALAQPFRRGEKVLLVGEGNFSFAHSLLLPLSTAEAESTSSPVPLPLVTPSLLLATSFDSHKTALEKYPDVESHVEALRAAGATVLFEVDATKLESNKHVLEFCGLGAKGKGKGKGKEVALEEEGAGFDKIVFNFPHVGQGITDQDRNVRTNQTLLLDFYLSASHILRRGTSHLGTAAAAKKSRQLNREVSRSPSPEYLVADDAEPLDADRDPSAADDATGLDSTRTRPPPPPPSTRGTILLTLRTNAPYSLWLPAHLATKPSLLVPSILSPPALKQGNRLKTQPVYKTTTSWEFEPSWFEGYEHRRTIGWDERKSFKGNEDLRRSAKERVRLGHGGGHDDGDDDDHDDQAGRGAKKAGGKGAGKGDKEQKKGTNMRTWQFELVDRHDGRPKDSGWAGAKRKRAAAQDDDDDDDLSD
ncbi:hypothetical protein JCM10212_000829 [Sporobolomyces blumeae]